LEFRRVLFRSGLCLVGHLLDAALDRQDRRKPPDEHVAAGQDRYGWRVSDRRGYAPCRSATAGMIEVSLSGHLSLSLEGSTGSAGSAGSTGSRDLRVPKVLRVVGARFSVLRVCGPTMRA